MQRNILRWFDELCDEMSYMDVYDSNFLKTGKILPRVDGYLGKGEYFLAVHIWIVNSKGEFLLQKRSSAKSFEPNKWSIHGGGVDAGEESVVAAVRETFEEIGVELNKDSLELVARGLNNNAWLVDVWLAKQDVNIDDVIIKLDEVSDVMWATEECICKMYETGEFAPNVMFGLEAIKKRMCSWGNKR